MDTYAPEFLRLTKAFHQHGVCYILVGGFAVNKHGFNRTTADVDVYLEDTKANRRSLIDALEAMGYGRFEPLMHAPLVAGFSEIMMDDGIYADLMTQIKGLRQEDFKEHYDAAIVAEIDGSPVRFLSLNHLISTKEAAGRPKDLLDIEELKRLHRPE